MSLSKPWWYLIFPWLVKNANKAHWTQQKSETRYNHKRTRNRAQLKRCSSHFSYDLNGMVVIFVFHVQSAGEWELDEAHAFEPFQWFMNLLSKIESQFLFLHHRHRCFVLTFCDFCHRYYVPFGWFLLILQPKYRFLLQCTVLGASCIVRYENSHNQLIKCVRKSGDDAMYFVILFVFFACFLFSTIFRCVYFTRSTSMCVCARALYTLCFDSSFISFCFIFLSLSSTVVFFIFMFSRYLHLW